MLMLSTLWLLRININIDINTRKVLLFPPSGTGPTAGSDF